MARPPRIPDASILALIAELRAQHPALTGLLLRAELARRYGTPSGVRRVYRLFRQATHPPAVAQEDNQSLADVGLHAQLTQAIERARLAEEREDAHQSRWAAEVDSLRTRLRQAHAAEHRLPFLEATLQDRSRELTAAYHRIAELEARLR